MLVAKPEAMHCSLGIYLTDEENPGDRLMKAVRPIIGSNGVHYLHKRR